MLKTLIYSGNHYRFVFDQENSYLLIKKSDRKPMLLAALRLSFLMHLVSTTRRSAQWCGLKLPPVTMPPIDHQKPVILRVLVDTLNYSSLNGFEVPNHHELDDQTRMYSKHPWRRKTVALRATARHAKILSEDENEPNPRHSSQKSNVRVWHTDLLQRSGFYEGHTAPTKSVKMIAGLSHSVNESKLDSRQRIKD